MNDPDAADRAGLARAEESRPEAAHTEATGPAESRTGESRAGESRPDESQANRGPRSAGQRVTFVIPTFDEQDSLRKLHRAICEVAGAEGLELQIVFVDDGSRDRSWEEIRALVAGDQDTAGRGTTEAIRFRRNFGKAAALDAGFSVARGDVVITMDADLQDDPKEIPRFLAKLGEGYDVVSGWKRVRHDPWHKVLPSRVFNWLVSRMTGVELHDHNCGFKAYRREIFDEVRLYGERHRFVPVLAAAHGWRVSEIEVEHHRREFGHSKYGVSRIVKGFLDLLTIYFLTGFGKRPLHLVGAAGLICFALGAVGMAYLSVAWVVTRMTESLDDVHLHRTAIFYYCILAVLLGAQFLLTGLIAELIVSQSPRRSVPYSVAERIGREAAGDDE